MSLLPLLPHVIDALTIFVSVVLADLLVSAIHRARKRRWMRELNRRSIEARRRRRGELGQ